MDYSTQMGEAIKPDDPRIGYAILSLPVLHLLFSSIYIWGYGRGFGAELNSFVTATDLFTTSIRDMVQVYISGFLIPVFYLIVRYARTYPTAEARVDDFSDPAQQAVARSKLYRIRVYLTLALCTFTVVVFTFQFWDFYRGEPISYLGLYPVASLWAVLGMVKLREIWWMSDLTYEIATLLVCVTVSAAFFGLHLGHTDRYAKWQNQKNKPICGQYRVMRSLSDRYLAMDSKSRQIIIDSECEVKFVIPNPLTGWEKKPEAQPRQPYSYYGLVVGSTKAEVGYKLGYPTKVMTPFRDDPDQPGWKISDDLEVNKSGNIDKNNPSPGRALEQFDKWRYVNGNDWVDVEFDASNKKLLSVSCLGSTDGPRSGCQQLAGVAIGTSEADLLEKLGKPMKEEITAVFKSMDYSNIGLRFMLDKQGVYLMSLSAPAVPTTRK